MCGIVGILEANTSPSITEDLLVRMRDTMVHRGPDEAGVYLSEDRKVGLGHRRLSIVDLATGKQPMSNEDGTIWLVYNGEIYNHMDLRPGLEAKGHVYRTHSDTESIIHLYEEKGIDCVHDLRGMFAFALWDTRKKQLFLARDRIGIKPLYFTRTGGRFIFASEIKAILEHPSVERDVDVEALYHYLTFVTTPAPRTLFAGISKMRPGERMTIDATGKVTSDIYWDAIVARPERHGAEESEEYYQERILELLRESVKLRLMSDVPFGVFLSGGVDSTTIVALMAEIMDRPVDTFSVGFKDQPAYNELEYARQASRAFGTNQHEILIDHRDLVSYLPQLIYHQDEPIADPVCVPLYYVSKLLRDSGVIMVLVGEGSDELFCGYEHHFNAWSFYQRRWQHFMRLPGVFRRALYHTAAPIFRSKNQHYRLDYLRRAAYDESLFWGGAIAYWETEKGEVISEGLRGRMNGVSSWPVVKEYLDKIERAKPEADYLEKMIYLELKIRLPELLLMRVDKVTMSTSVEARVPFLDHKLVEFAMNVPSALKTKGQPKYILKKAVEGLIPDNIIYRRKQGFGAPIREWARGPLEGYFNRALFESSIRERRFFDYDYVRRMVDLHQRGENDYSFYLWNLFNVSQWYDRWIAKVDLAAV